jgi:hypothetical protein
MKIEKFVGGSIPLQPPLSPLSFKGDGLGIQVEGPEGLGGVSPDEFFNFHFALFTSPRFVFVKKWPTGYDIVFNLSF